MINKKSRTVHLAEEQVDQLRYLALRRGESFDVALRRVIKTAHRHAVAADNTYRRLGLNRDEQAEFRKSQ
jgi:hypothetical protein